MPFIVIIIILILNVITIVGEVNRVCCIINETKSTHVCTLLECDYCRIKTCFIVSLSTGSDDDRLLYYYCLCDWSLLVFNLSLRSIIIYYYSYILVPVVLFSFPPTKDHILCLYIQTCAYVELSFFFENNTNLTD